jgi:2,4-dienoyl-CoA reductase-like NADH-dependent reductase (Old Yellow Enzyme family)
MSALFTPSTLRGLHLPNRIFVSPMCQYSAVRGEATAWHMIHLGSLALSGASMLFIEATAVEPDGRITPGDLGLWDDATEDALRPVLAAIRDYSDIAVTMQLAHAGRKASSAVPWEGGQLISVADGGWMTHAPSAIPHKDDETPPLALDTAGLLRVKEAFVASARRAARLGIDGIELHCAHGYLLHEFLSPLANQRTDEYGGSRENRMRYPLEIFDAIRAVFPQDKPVGVRVSASDWVEGGWDIDDTIAFAVELKKRGVDWIDASSGGVSPRQKITLEPNYQVPFARAIKETTGIPTIAVGLITEAKQANEIIERGEADYVAIARGMLYDPRWAWHAAAELGDSVSAPPQYWRSQPREQKHLFGDITIGQR